MIVWELIKFKIKKIKKIIEYENKIKIFHNSISEILNFGVKKNNFFLCLVNPLDNLCIFMKCVVHTP